MIDPPGGWKYGFPKPYPKTTDEYIELLISSGYPEKDLDLALRYSKYFYEEIEDGKISKV